MTVEINVPDGSCVVVCALEWIERYNKGRRRFHAKHARSTNKQVAAYYKTAVVPELRLVKILGKVESRRVSGKDQWGLFYNFTSHEAKGNCFWCGLTNIRGRYCCDAHLWAYKRHFNWPFARDWCWRRYSNHCGLCGTGKIEKPIDWRWRTLEVHHIEPLNAGFRDWTLLNRPENLILLCPPCHDSTRKKDFKGIPKAAVDPNQLIFI